MYRIMIVEDDEVIARAVQQSLVFLGHGCVLRTGFFRRSRRICREKSCKLVLMDIHLPFF